MIQEPYLDEEEGIGIRTILIGKTYFKRLECLVTIESEDSKVDYFVTTSDIDQLKSFKKLKEAKEYYNTLP